MSAPADPSLQLLLQHLRETPPNRAPYLWLADEHHNSALTTLAPYREQLTLLTNRFDIAQQAEQAGLTYQFSDWNLTGKAGFERIYLRICKEKPVNLHLLRLAFNQLRNGGQLLLAGQKNEGVKTTAKQAEDIFASPCALKKHGSAYFAEVLRNVEPALQGAELHDNNQRVDLSEYHQLHSIGQWRGLNLQSKVGVYGWNKIDRGSELLIETVEDYLVQYKLTIESVLDIGCGYGFLSLAATSIPCTRRVATDNNAAALLCTAANAHHHALDLEVIASDCANTVDGRFDLVLCNPPFHKGFDVESDLTQRFVHAAARKIQNRGIAFFVVNSFIALEKKIRGHFSTYETLVNNGQFKVIALKP